VTGRSVTHDQFAVERTYDASPARVFHAFADPAVKARWFGAADDWSGADTEFDFRVGGREFHRSMMDGRLHTFEGRFWDIVPDERIVFTYDMHVDEVRISVSLATVELKPAGAGTRLTFTEQGAFLDGFDMPASRQDGTGWLLDALGAELDRQAKEEEA
jgi:uncharacterized protein YndB with AHSA1/START domain